MGSLTRPEAEVKAETDFAPSQAKHLRRVAPAPVAGTATGWAAIRLPIRNCGSSKSSADTCPYGTPGIDTVTTCVPGAEFGSVKSSTSDTPLNSARLSAQARPGKPWLEP